MPTVAEPTSAYTPEERRRRIVDIVAASSGNLVEWFDFYVFSFCSLYLAPAFFPKADPTAQLLNTAGVFAAGFLMRPVGSWLFGRIADRHGRRGALVTSIVLMCGASLLIACLPTFATIGEAAPALLLAARLLQGLSVGGEYGATATYMSEVAMRGRRGYYSSFQYVTLIGGQLLAVSAIALLQLALDDAALRAWGWRIPFVASAAAALVAFTLRRRLEETSTAASRASRHAGSVAELWRHHRRAALTVIGFTAGGSLVFYTFTTYMQKFLVNSAHLPARTATQVMTACLTVFMLVQPLFGALSDRIGRRRNLLWFGVLGAVATVPILGALRGAGPLLAGALITAALLIVSLYTSVSAIVKAEMFPVEVRAVGVGLSYALGNAVFGGTAESVALWLKGAGHEELFFGYVAAMLAAVAALSLTLPREPAYLLRDR
ncbi:MAG: MFS transporter [Proteobacteria bacterium]|nr:MFS transporter [Pseudomonadota bacterium]